jgi:chromosome segregation ATPase
VKFDPLVDKTADSQKVNKHLNHVSSSDIAESDDLLLMSTPPRQQKPASSKNVSTVAPESKVEDDHLVDKILTCSPADDNTPKPATQSVSSKKLPVMGDGDSNSDITEVLRFTQADVKQMRKTFELEFQAQILTKERDWAQKWEEQKRELERKYVEMDAEKKGYKDKIQRLQKSHEEMKVVIGEYEATIQKLIAEKEVTTSESKVSMADLLKERDQALEDLKSVESAFSDLHRRYEKTKTVVEAFKKNEDTLKKCMADYQSKLKKSEEKYLQLKKQAEEKLIEANEEIDKVKRTNASDMAVLQAALRKAEIQAQSLEQTVEQKTKENRELTAICDELISKVGPR